MSEMDTSAATVTDAAPTTTAGIAASVIETAEQQADSGEATTEAPTIDASAEAVEVPAVAALEQPKPADLSPAAKFLLEQGHKAKTVDGRDSWLKVGTVEKMLDRYVQQHESEWTGSRTTLESQVKELNGHLKEMYADIAGDPKALIEKIAAADPRYRVFLAPQAQAVQTPPKIDDRPKPDVDLGNGSWTYSPEGVEALTAWKAQQLLDARLKPWEDRDKADADRAKQAALDKQLTDRTQSTMQEAQTWPLFGPLAADGSLTEVQAAVLAELKKDSDAAQAAGKRPTLTLEGAYIRVTGPRFTEDDNARRARLLKEIGAAPKSPALARQPIDAGKPGKPASTADIARQVMSQLEA